ncbi:hypothetical protein QC762_0063510 [Podospora pseudocomata]|uniref:Uncharacterized protein n=1 Tax=Podospora pseudocomata TaxID=2093779 RepID=A0ABR0GEW9_9PEZI|nr:hypothetical protein QC762_0063510 [Podospora pseudocomata]
MADMNVIHTYLAVTTDVPDQGQEMASTTSPAATPTKEEMVNRWEELKSPFEHGVDWARGGGARGYPGEGTALPGSYCNKIGVTGLREWVLGNVDSDTEEGAGGGWYRFLKGVFEPGDDEKV